MARRASLHLSAVFHQAPRLSNLPAIAERAKMGKLTKKDVPALITEVKRLQVFEVLCLQSDIKPKPGIEYSFSDLKNDAKSA